MLRKVVLGGLLIGLIGFLIAGAVIRTNAISGSGETAGRHGATVADAGVYERGGNGGGGRWLEEDAGVVDGTQGLDAEVHGGGWAQGGNGGRGPGRSSSEADVAGQQPQADVEPTDWVSYTGTIVSATDDLVEVEAATGEIIPFEGRPLSFAQEQGFGLEVGDRVLLQGFDEDGEFKLGRVENLTAGDSVTLRDTSGRPGWAGRGRRL